MILAPLLLALSVVQIPPESNRCLAFVATNLAKGNANFYIYREFSDRSLLIRDGDVLTYLVYLDPRNPTAKGGIDIDFADNRDSLRDLGLMDDDGRRAHGDAVLPAGKWITRRIALAGVAGRTTKTWNVVFEGDQPGDYAQFVDAVRIDHRDGTKTVISEGDAPPASPVQGRNGYSELTGLVSVDANRVAEPATINSVVTEVRTAAERFARTEEARQSVALAEKFLARNPNPELKVHIEEAKALLTQAERPDATATQIEAALHEANHALSHTHPVMERYTGHLVGHAHIDLQWLWEWQEGIVFSRDTFAQAVKFMDEYPGFTFSQSSSALYQTIEQNYPALFKKIQEKVRKGQWELVGGRVCEGDNNLISGESHARHFLYGQGYFRDKFGRVATVGWEPDTFGHPASMPQILRLGGCKYYYFCRGGKNKPLFHWKGIDGSTVLAFDEPATGSWYNSDLSYKQFEEMLEFQTVSGSQDSLMVYGVGNHGGGPTREYIETALGWMKDKSKPKVRFSTASEFFRKLETYDLKNIPTIAEELNPVFEGCYTSHAEIKAANRDAEAATQSAEAVSTVASAFGFSYPRAAFRRNWEEIAFNHHHDTLPGSGIHAPYERTKASLGRVVAEDREIAIHALETLAIRQSPYSGGGITQLVFNPTGHPRSGWIEGDLVQSGWDNGERMSLEDVTATDPQGLTSPVEIVDRDSRRIRFWATDVPAFGWRSFHLTKRTGAMPAARAVNASADGLRVATSRWDVTFSPEMGCIQSLTDRSTSRELAGPNGLGRLERHLEGPGGMSAWVLGPITEVTAYPVISRTITRFQGRVDVAFRYRMPAWNSTGRETTVSQIFSVREEGIEAKIEADWQDIGRSDNGGPMLRARFDTALQKPQARYEIPFGWLERPVDGREMPALRWADLSDAQGGITVVNDRWHGATAFDSSLRFSLIRSSYDPDPVPNRGLHSWRYALIPHGPNASPESFAQSASELNQPMLTATVPFDATGNAPKEWTPFRLSAGSSATALKVGERTGDWILRLVDLRGTGGEFGVTPSYPIRSAEWVNFMEERIEKANPAGILAKHRPFEIRTLRITSPVVPKY